MKKHVTPAAWVLTLLAACGGSHKHGPTTNTDPHKLFVEIWPQGRSHAGQLRAGAAAGLQAVPFAVTVDHGGEVELQIEVSDMHEAGADTSCSVKILVLRLPTHDLLGIADGTATARGTHDDAKDDCVERLAMSLVKGRVRGLLREQLEFKR